MNFRAENHRVLFRQQTLEPPLPAWHSPLCDLQQINFYTLVSFFKCKNEGQYHVYLYGLNEEAHASTAYLP